MLAPILSAKMIDPDVNGFYLVREVSFRCFSTFKLPKKTRSKLEKIFSFELILSFCVTF
jgi:hypothetical protein